MSEFDPVSRSASHGAPLAGRGRGARAEGEPKSALRRFPAPERAEIAELLAILSARPGDVRAENDAG